MESPVLLTGELGKRFADNTASDSSRLLYGASHSSMSLPTLSYGGKEYEIRYNKWNATDISWYFFNEKRLAAQCEGEIKNKQFWIDYVWQEPTHRGLMRDIYKNFLLERFKMVVSDQTLSSRGLIMWKTFMQDPSLRVGIVKNGNYKNLKTPDEMDQHMHDVVADHKIVRFYLTKA